jgi:putative transposase
MTHPKLSVRRQCQLLSLNRSSLYYEGKQHAETPANVALMNAIDRQYTQMPYYGVRRMTQAMRLAGFHVNHKRVSRLMRKMGLEAIYPKPRLSVRNQQDKIYPYLLKGVKVNRPNQVWATDITYIPMVQGFAYLVAIMDWHSRYVLSWQVSTSLDSVFCIQALEEALARYPQPDIFNTDQGSQFTSQGWLTPLQAAGIRISMDGKGRYLDNIFVERLWRTVKYEDIYIKRYETVTALKAGLKAYFHQYNHQRLHQALGYKTPSQVYFQIQNGQKPLNENFSAVDVNKPLKIEDFQQLIDNDSLYYDDYLLTPDPMRA